MSNMLINFNRSISQIEKEIEKCKKLPSPVRSKYYRFRLTENEIKQIEKNKKELKQYDLILSDVVRYFALNCVDFNVLWDLGLITQYDRATNKRVVKHKVRPK